MKPAFFLILLSSLSLYAKVLVETDFGKRGNVEKIAEESLKDTIERSLKDFNGTQKRNEFIQSVDNVGNATLGIPHCDANITRTIEPGMVLSKNYYSPDGKLIAKAGDKLNPLRLTKNVIVKPDVIVFDGTSQPQLEYIRQNREASARLFITKGNSFKVKQIIGKEVYPLPNPIAQVLEIRCSMSVYKADGEKFIVKEIALKEREDAKK